MPLEFIKSVMKVTPRSNHCLKRTLFVSLIIVPKNEVIVFVVFSPENLVLEKNLTTHGKIKLHC